MVRHEIWTLILKPLGITLKKAVEKVETEKLKYVLCYSNDVPATVRDDLWTLQLSPLYHPEKGSRKSRNRKNKKKYVAPAMV
jgi:hypothetical protein